MKVFVLSALENGGWVVNRTDSKDKELGTSAHSNRKNALNRVMSEVKGCKNIIITVQEK